MKRSKVFAHLKSLSKDIMFLQETHIKQTAKGKLRLRLHDDGLNRRRKSGVAYSLFILRLDKRFRGGNLRA